MCGWKENTAKINTLVIIFWRVLNCDKVYFSSRENNLLIFSSLDFIRYIKHILKQPGLKTKPNQTKSKQNKTKEGRKIIGKK